jgi:putative hydrolase of the HAD superfamily
LILVVPKKQYQWSEKMKIEGIFFDMGGTLDLYPTSEKGVQNACLKMKRMLEAAGADQISRYSETEFQKMIVNGIQKYKNWRKGQADIELSPEKIFSDFVLTGTGIDPGIINALGEELAFLVDTDFHDRIPRPEAAAVVKAIKNRGIRLGIISNVISRTQVEYSLKKYGLYEYFDPIILSSVFGKRKPHPAIFRHAFQAAGIDQAHLIFVGNSPAKDIAGAKKAGVGKTVYIEYGETPADELGAVAADYNIKNLRELIVIIDMLGSSFNNYK